MAPQNVRHKSATALLLIDVINHFEFPDGPRLLRQARPIAARIARLKARAQRLRIPVIYVNDNFGQWRSDAKTLLQYCVRPDAAGREFVETLRPDKDDYFVLKPMHSAFYQTPLEALLRELRASTLVLTGLATHSCIACTAHDADMRDFGLIIPSDCCAARSLPEHRQAIKQIKTIGEVRVLPSTALTLSRRLGNKRN